MTSEPSKKSYFTLFAKLLLSVMSTRRLISLACLGIAVVLLIATWQQTNWRVALIPFSIFLSAAIYLIVQDYWIRTDRIGAAKIAPQTGREGIHEGVNLAIWLLAFLIFLIWGLNGGWSIAWIILLLTGIIEWVGDRVATKRRIK
ncbi:MAG: hypothetical protein PHC86_05980 [Eubacteriales bacterium]|nr:hypothetical protein [Eubacteriales bacterium]